MVELFFLTAEQRTQLKGCAGLGRRGSFLPSGSEYFHPSVFRIEAAFAVFHKALLLEASTPLWLAPQQIRGPSVSDSSVRLSELFVLLFPAGKSQPLFVLLPLSWVLSRFPVLSCCRRCRVEQLSVWE